jgi:glutaminyl-peptide cyclotransferase
MKAFVPVLAALTAVGAAPTAPRSTYRIVRVYPHDRAAFTQGLEYHDGFLYEGTGLNGQSSIRKVNLETGKVVQKRNVGAQYFGEGITIWKDELIELTWRARTGFVYDLATFQRKRTFSYDGEGWGLTNDGHSLIMSDGTASLRFLDPDTFAEQRRITVTDGGVPIPSLNELEWVDGEIYANVWQTRMIARIAPDTGRVLGWIDLKGILSPADAAGTDVMNGIAYDAQHKRLFITGKLWPKIFEIEVIK